MNAAHVAWLTLAVAATIVLFILPRDEALLTKIVALVAAALVVAAVPGAASGRPHVLAAPAALRVAGRVGLGVSRCAPLRK